jgi:two-component system NarL family sensor kinase
MSTAVAKPESRRGRLALAALLPLVGLALVSSVAVVDPGADTVWLFLPALTVILAPGVVGFLILRRDDTNRIGWLLAAHSALVGTGFSTPPEGSDAKWVMVVAQISAGWWVLLYLCLVLIGYLFPTGHFRNARWRRWVQVCLAGYVLFVVGAMDDPDTFHEAYPGRELPLNVLPDVVSGVMGMVGLLFVVASLVGTVFCARARLRDASGDERLQLLWFSWAAVSIPATIGCCWIDFALTGGAGTITILAICLLGSVIPLVIGVAILRTRLFDIELVLSRTLTYGVLTVGVVGTYALVLLLTQRWVGNDSVGGLIAVGVVAVALLPAHGWLRRRVERWVYGDRSDPGLALRRLAARVEGATDPAGVIDSVSGSVVDALRVERAWIERDAVPDGTDDDRVVRVPLVHRGERLGDLAVEVPRGRNLSAADVALLHDLARHAAVVVQAATLAADLQASRARLVTAREEERRRLRRDLHDGLGPSLAAIVLKLNATQNRKDESARAELLSQTLDEATSAISEVRRLVDDLRPPAIDEVGLIGAIRQRAASLTQGSELAVDVSGPASLPPLPAAVEVAAFRIAAEAMTNVSRHSGATQCLVHVAVNGAFELTVSDNGRGARQGTSSGVGWTSMSERAEELGGSCTVTSRNGGGLVVRALLPLTQAEAEAGVEAGQP